MGLDSRPRKGSPDAATLDTVLSAMRKAFSQPTLPSPRIWYETCIRAITSGGILEARVRHIERGVKEGRRWALDVVAKAARRSGGHGRGDLNATEAFVARVKHDLCGEPTFKSLTRRRESHN